MTSLTIEVVPDLWMTENTNRRDHWAKKHTRVRDLRDLARIRARAEQLPRGLDAVHITAHISFPDKRRRDLHNTMPVLKALIDGLIDYGLTADDDLHHVIGPDIRYAGTTPGTYTVRLDVIDQTVPFARPSGDA